MNELVQLIPGNPGTSYIASLLFVLSRKYNIEFRKDKQLDLFCNGIRESRKTFFAKTIDLIALEYNKMIYGFTDSDYLLKLAREESESRLVSYEPFKLNENTLQQLIEKHDFVVLSADIFYFNNSYHDYHFCCIGKQEGEYRLFEPKSGSEKEVTYKEISDIIQSISENLGDAILAFCV